MKYKTLENTSIEEIVACFAEAFKNYFVPITDDVSYWKNRFKNANVDYANSWGVFDQGKLVAYIINAIDTFEGQRTAYNTGTGVIASYRGNQLVDKMYDFGLQKLKDNNVKQCLLEVIDENYRAIRVYERIGFQEIDKLYCFKIDLEERSESRIQKNSLNELVTKNNHYSWDFMSSTIMRAESQYEAYQVSNKNEVVGFFIINQQSCSVAQLESDVNDWESLFDGISQVKKSISITNVRASRKHLLSYLNQLNADNHINQLLMKKTIE